ncbi:MAG: phosphopantothenoylcysteine decarboxylase [Endomicrobiia bacterium]
MYKHTKTVLITAGPTREFIDPVRYISNLSSGKLGYKIAEEFFSCGYKVILISGPTCVKTDKKIKILKVTTSDEMFYKVKKYFSKSDIFVSVAAVCDYKPKFFYRQKIKKSKSYSLNLVATKDILKYFGNKKNNRQIVVGFALETDKKNFLKYAINKLKEKNLDLIVLNSPETFNSEYIKPTVIFSNGKKIFFKKIKKKKFAKILVSIIKEYEQNKSAA